MISKMREKAKNKKGFTLVELIVVLVILAILIALLVPALTGYIDKAKQRGVETEARNALIAAQTEVGELYKDVEEGAFGFADNTAKTTLITAATKLSEVPGTITKLEVSSDGKVSELEYQNKGYTAKYTGSTGKWAVEKTTSNQGEE